MSYFAGIIVMFMISSCVYAEQIRCPSFRDYNNDIVGNIEKFVDEPLCPPTISFTNDASYCCYDEHLMPRCCEMNEFIMNMSVFGIIILVILLLLSTLISCFCCFCCPCCFLYQRRTGRVVTERYEPVSSPGVSERTEYNVQMTYPAVPTTRTHHLPPGAIAVFPPTSGDTAKSSTYRSHY